MKELQEVWKNSKKLIFNIVGVTSLVIGTIALFVPGVPGWPFLLFGSFCLKLAKEVEQENEVDAS